MRNTTYKAHPSTTTSKYLEDGSRIYSISVTSSRGAERVALIRTSPADPDRAEQVEIYTPDRSKKIHGAPAGYTAAALAAFSLM